MTESRELAEQKMIDATADGIDDPVVAALAGIVYALLAIEEAIRGAAR